MSTTSQPACSRLSQLARAADGLAINLGEPRTVPITEWLEQIVHAADSRLELVRVPDEALPPELALTGAPAQHVIASVHRAEHLLDWAPADPARRVAESVRWHLANPPDTRWTEEDTRAADGAISATRSEPLGSRSQIATRLLQAAVPRPPWLNLALSYKSCSSVARNRCPAT